MKIIWLVSGTNGVLQAYEDKADADAFAEQFQFVKVNSCALIEKDLIPKLEIGDTIRVRGCECGSLQDYAGQSGWICRDSSCKHG